MDVRTKHISPITLLVIDNYDSFTYNLSQAFQVLGAEVTVQRNDDPLLMEKHISGFMGIVISPGPGRPENAGKSCDIIREWRHHRPILGVCLGMQCINEVWGGTTVHAAEPVHGKTSSIRHSGTGLFAGVPNPFDAMRYHSLVIKPSPGLRVTARTSRSIPMAVEAIGLPTWGVQFHPESFLTPHGPVILRNFLAVCKTLRRT
ncbi:MAG: aminodeoxychorismate/anthranilate synthase component II [Planctomycetota bacterium]